MRARNESDQRRACMGRAWVPERKAKRVARGCISAALDRTWPGNVIERGEETVGLRPWATSRRWPSPKCTKGRATSAGAGTKPERKSEKRPCAKLTKERSSEERKREIQLRGRAGGRKLRWLLLRWPRAAVRQRLQRVKGEGGLDRRAAQSANREHWRKPTASPHVH
jgi:hypothetical protein